MDMENNITAEQPISSTPEEVCDILVGIDPMGIITFLRYVSSRVAAIAGYSEKEVVGLHVTDFIAGTDSVAAIEHFGRLYAGETAFRAPSRKLKAKNGAVIDSETYVVPSYDDAGKFTGHYVMVFFKLPQAAVPHSQP